ncbi:MAG TPA: hypothetical protein VL099_12870 [Candidatus Binatia bacterium]|nr:hypothetical protein [Candidatus Binatia bacterium]
MIDLYLYGTLAVLLLVAAIRLLLHSGPGAAAQRARREDPSRFFPVHCRYFPQMRQLFSIEDADFLATRGSPALLQRWRADRKHAALLYLSSLREDFAGLNRLSRNLARHAANLEAKQQAQVIGLNLQFQLLYTLATAQILMGLPAGAELQRITRLVAGLGGRLEKVALAPYPSSGSLIP